MRASVAESALLSCLGAGDQAIALFDPQDVLHFANDTFLALFDVPANARATFGSIMAHCHQSGRGLQINTDDFARWMSDVQGRRRNVGKRSFEADFADGRWIWVNEIVLPDGWLCFCGSDITALKHNEKALSHARDCALQAAYTDALTGLYNRRYMDEQLEQAYARLSGAIPAPFCIGVLDLDYFKRINDHYGHQAGDLVLQHFCQEVKTQLRPSDVLGRIGGEEFMLLLPHTERRGAHIALQRIRRGLKRSYARLPVPGLEYSFSAGLAEAAIGEDADALFRRADQALYRAKQGGRDRHTLAPSASPASA